MWLNCLFLGVAITAGEAVKIDMLGSISLGKDVAKILTNYFKDDAFGVNGRRSMNRNLDEILGAIKQIPLCKGIENLCDEKMQDIILDYVVDLTNVVKSSFDVVEDEFCKVKYIHKSLKLVRKVVNSTSVDLDEVYRWTDVIKKISAIFLEKAMELCEEVLNKQSKKNKELVFVILRQQMVFSMIDVEKEYQLKLCKDFRICPFRYDASTYLQHFLNLIKTMDDTKVINFLKEFKKTFLGSPLFAELDSRTLKRFVDTLNDMSVHGTAKYVLLSIGDVVQKRLSLIEPIETDALLLQAILSDLDHLYVSSVDEPIESFLDSFKGWLKTNDALTLSSSMEKVYHGLGAHFLNQPPELVSKIKTEALVFLEVTVGPSHAA